LQIVGAVRTMLHDPAEYAAMSNAVNPYGDGLAAERSVAAVAHMFGLGEKPVEFGAELFPTPPAVDDPAPVD
jgi:UDP-N-acetylglucosamine 2-epimerase (non-hydrolysing)